MYEHLARHRLQFCNRRTKRRRASPRSHGGANHTLSDRSLQSRPTCTLAETEERRTVAAIMNACCVRTCRVDRGAKMKRR